MNHPILKTTVSADNLFTWENNVQGVEDDVTHVGRINSLAIGAAIYHVV